MAKCPPIILTPFFQLRDEDAVEQRMYVAGFADEAGEAWGTLIPLDGKMVEQAVLGHQIFTVWCNSNGRIQPQPNSDDLYEELLEKGQLKETMNSSPKPSSRARMSRMMTSSICSRPCITGLCGRKAWSLTRSRGAGDDSSRRVCVSAVQWCRASLY